MTVDIRSYFPAKNPVFREDSTQQLFTDAQIRERDEVSPILPPSRPITPLPSPEREEFPSSQGSALPDFALTLEQLHHEGYHDFYSEYRYKVSDNPDNPDNRDKLRTQRKYFAHILTHVVLKKLSPLELFSNIFFFPEGTKLSVYQFIPKEGVQESVEIPIRGSTLTLSLFNCDDYSAPFTLCEGNFVRIGIHEFAENVQNSHRLKIGTSIAIERRIPYKYNWVNADLLGKITSRAAQQSPLVDLPTLLKPINLKNNLGVIKEGIRKLEKFLRSHLSELTEEFKKKGHWHLPDEVWEKAKEATYIGLERHQMLFQPTASCDLSDTFLNNPYALKQFCLLKIREIAWYLLLKETGKVVPKKRAPVCLKFLSRNPQTHAYEVVEAVVSYGKNALALTLNNASEIKDYRTLLQAILKSRWALAEREKTTIRFSEELLESDILHDFNQTIQYAVLANQVRLNANQEEKSNFWEIFAHNHRSKNPSDNNPEFVDKILEDFHAQFLPAPPIDSYSLLDETQKSYLKTILQNVRSHFGALLYQPVGSGKTRLAIAAIKENLKKYPWRKYLIFVPNKTIKDTWEKEINLMNEGCQGEALTYRSLDSSNKKEVFSITEAPRTTITILVKDTFHQTVKRQLTESILNFAEERLELKWKEHLKLFCISDTLVVGNREDWEMHLAAHVPEKSVPELLSILEKKQKHIETRLNTYLKFTDFYHGMILDESHLQLKATLDPKKKHDPSEQNLNYHLIELSRHLLMHADDKLVLALSATPWPNSMEGLRNHYRLLAPNFFSRNSDLHMHLTRSWDKFQETVAGISARIHDTQTLSEEQLTAQAAQDALDLQPEVDKINRRFMRWITTLFDRLAIHQPPPPHLEGEAEKEELGVLLDFTKVDNFEEQKKTILEWVQELPPFEYYPKIPSIILSPYRYDDLDSVSFDTLKKGSFLLTKIGEYLDEHYSEGVPDHSTAFYLIEKADIAFLAAFLGKHPSKLKPIIFTGDVKDDKGRKFYRRAFNDEICFEDFIYYIKHELYDKKKENKKIKAKKDSLFKHLEQKKEYFEKILLEKKCVVEKNGRFLLNRKKIKKAENTFDLMTHLQESDRKDIFIPLFKCYLTYVFRAQFFVFNSVGMTGIHLEANDLWILSDLWSHDQLKQLKGRVGRRGGLREISKCRIFHPTTDLPFELYQIKMYLEKNSIDKIATGLHENLLEYPLLAGLLAHTKRSSESLQVEDLQAFASMGVKEKALALLDPEVRRRFQLYFPLVKEVGEYRKERQIVQVEETEIEEPSEFPIFALNEGFAAKVCAYAKREGPFDLDANEQTVARDAWDRLCALSKEKGSIISIGTEADILQINRDSLLENLRWDEDPLPEFYVHITDPYKKVERLEVDETVELFGAEYVLMGAVEGDAHFVAKRRGIHDDKKGYFHCDDDRIFLRKELLSTSLAPNTCFLRYVCKERVETLEALVPRNLENLGNTCFINALYQLVETEELRKLIEEFENTPTKQLLKNVSLVEKSGSTVVIGEPNKFVSRTLVLMYPTRGCAPDLSGGQFIGYLRESLEGKKYLEGRGQIRPLDQILLYIGINHRKGNPSFFDSFVNEIQETLKTPFPKEVNLVVHCYQVEWEDRNPTPKYVPIGAFRNHLFEKCKDAVVNPSNKAIFVSMDGDTEITPPSLGRVLERCDMDPKCMGTNGYQFPLCEGVSKWTVLANQISVNTASQLNITKEKSIYHFCGYPSEPMLFAGGKLLQDYLEKSKESSHLFGGFNNEGSIFSRTLSKNRSSLFGPSLEVKMRPIVHNVKRFAIDFAIAEETPWTLETLDAFMRSCCKSPQNVMRPFIVCDAIGLAIEQHRTTLMKLASRLYWRNIIQQLKLGPWKGKEFIRVVRRYQAFIHKEGPYSEFAAYVQEFEKNAKLNPGELEPFIEKVFKNCFEKLLPEHCALLITWARHIGTEFETHFGKGFADEPELIVLPEQYPERSEEIAEEDHLLGEKKPKKKQGPTVENFLPPATKRKRERTVEEAVAEIDRLFCNNQRLLGEADLFGKVKELPLLKITEFLSERLQKEEKIDADKISACFANALRMDRKRGPDNCELPPPSRPRRDAQHEERRRQIAELVRQDPVLRTHVNRLYNERECSKAQIYAELADEFEEGEEISPLTLSSTLGLAI